MIQRAVKAAFWLLPVLALFWLYHDGLSTWFFLDDFAWLSLAHLVQVRHDLLHELFTPMAQGTIRPWSERGFFIVLRTLFGLDSLPFHLVVFATAAVNVLLIAWITLRATGSRIAGFLAPILWAANTALVLPMVWSSAYNEVMCTLFLLAALALFIRYIETERQVFWWAQLAVFILGFGALEINVVYPALAAAWLLFLPQPSLPPQPSGSNVAQALACGRDWKSGRSPSPHNPSSSRNLRNLLRNPPPRSPNPQIRPLRPALQFRYPENLGPLLQMGPRARTHLPLRSQPPSRDPDSNHRSRSQ